MLDGIYNPGQLVAVREILAGSGGFDTAVFQGNLADYTIIINDSGTPSTLQRRYRHGHRQQRQAASTAPTTSPMSSGCSSPISH